MTPEKTTHNGVIIRHLYNPGYRVVAVPGSTVEELIDNGKKWCGPEEVVTGTCDMLAIRGQQKEKRNGK